MNTAISQMMVFVNAATQANTLPKETMETFLRLLTPYAPHIAEELWERLGHTELIAHTSWPTHDPEALKREEVTIVVQVNGKLRNRIQFPVDSSNADVEAAVLADEKIQGYIEGKTVLADEKIQGYIEGKTVRKVIVVPNRLVNIVV
jgi:leucyl-tRNA synthetase